MESLFNAKAGSGSKVKYAQVAIEQGLDFSASGLTYAVPASMSDLKIGQRVIVPLGRANKKVSGIVLDLKFSTKLKGKAIKRIHDRDPQQLSLPVDLIELGRWLSAYYCSPLGMVFAAMLPAAVKHGTGSKVRTLVRIAEGGGGAVTAPDDLTAKLTKLQRAILAVAQDAAHQGEGLWIEPKQLADLGGARTIGPVKQLIKLGCLQTKQDHHVESDLDLRASRISDPAPFVELNEDQRNVLDLLDSHRKGGFGVHLLHGVTGSGKTEVYLQCIERVRNSLGGGLGQEPGVIVLVPEIALTPQTVARFRSRFDSVAVLHSGLTQAQRHAQWCRIRDSRASIVVGARSAVFAPVQNLKLVIVDEEHEPSYKQDQLPRYHARDVAIKRGQMNDIPVLLGSATPSLESYFNARGSRHNYHYLRLPNRVQGLTLPTVEVVDMTDERRNRYECTGHGGMHLLSLKLEARLTELIESGDGQALIFLNRRGFGNYIACPDHRCGWLMRCDFCDVTMVYHKDQALPAGGMVCCHHCEAERLLPSVCPVCGKRIIVFGLGTQRVEGELNRKFSGVVTARMDSDTMKHGRDYQQTLDRFRRGDIQILLGTQMIAKGLDFPGIRLVGIISADTALHLPDFRAAERTFQLIAQVAGRGGRSAKPSQAIVQTFNPSDPVIALAAHYDYQAFADREIQLRGEVGLPPVSRMVRIVLRDKDHLACSKRARELTAELKGMNQIQQFDVRVRGPAPCPIARIAEFYRQQIELLADDPTKIQKLMTALRNKHMLVSDAYTAVDVDPVSLM